MPYRLEYVGAKPQPRIWDYLSSRISHLSTIRDLTPEEIIEVMGALRKAFVEDVGLKEIRRMEKRIIVHSSDDAAVGRAIYQSSGVVSAFYSKTKKPTAQVKVLFALSDSVPEEKRHELSEIIQSTLRECGLEVYDSSYQVEQEEYPTLLEEALCLPRGRSSKR